MSQVEDWCVCNKFSSSCKLAEPCKMHVPACTQHLTKAESTLIQCLDIDSTCVLLGVMKGKTGPEMPELSVGIYRSSLISTCSVIAALPVI